MLLMPPPAAEKWTLYPSSSHTPRFIEFWGLQGSGLVHGIQRVPCSVRGLVTRGQMSSSSGSLGGTM